ncbi:MAG: urea ABC transporter permease subunit UrtB [Thermodesulfobacteriota bacterium]
MNSYRNNAFLRTLLMILPALLFVVQSTESFADEKDLLFQEGMQLLLEKDFKKKGRAIEKIGASTHPQAEEILQSLLKGKLYLLKKDNTFVYADIQGTKAALTSALKDEDLATVKKRKIKKITINNALRSRLKSQLAKMNLSAPDPEKRLAAINKLLPTLSADARPMLSERLAVETDESVRNSLSTGLAIIDLRSDDKEKRSIAMDKVKGSIDPAVRNELVRLIESEEDINIKTKAQSVLNSIEAKIAFYAKIETIFFGLSLGSILVLAAIGLAITFGVIGVINMAHGELIMLGAYTTYVLQQLMPNSIGLALILAIPAAFIVSGFTGILIERSVIRFLYGRPLETLLATFGISLILQQAVRSIFSPLNRSVATPDWLSGSLQINALLSITSNRLVILIFSMLVFAGLFITLKKSSIGLQVRAVSQNRAMARAMGVKASRVDALTFGLGSGIAGIAGVALSQLTNVGPNLGQAYIIDSFMVVVFGGVGNLWGTLVGGLTLGVANKFLEPWAGAVLAKILILVFIILFIQKRPQGLFPQKGRAAG